MPTAQAPTPAPAPHSGGSLIDLTIPPSRSGWLTVRDAAEALGITVRGVRMSIARGRLRAVKPAWMRIWLVSAEDVARAVEAREVRHDG